MCIFENTLNSLIKVLFLLSVAQCLEFGKNSHFTRKKIRVRMKRIFDMPSFQESLTDQELEMRVHK